MGLFSVIPIVGKVVEKGLDIIDDLVPDKDLAAKLKSGIKEKSMTFAHEEGSQLIEAQMKVMLAEMTGSWLQRNWRPLLMLTIIAIVFNNYVLFPYLSMFTDKATMLELPKGLWALLNVGVGGYIVGRSGEKIVTNLKGDK